MLSQYATKSSNPERTEESNLEHRSGVTNEDIMKYHRMGLNPSAISKKLREENKPFSSNGIRKRMASISVTPHRGHGGGFRGRRRSVPPEVMREYDGKGYSATKIHEDLRETKGYDVDITTVRRYIKDLKIEVSDGRYLPREKKSDTREITDEKILPLFYSGLTHEAMARRLGVSKPTVDRIIKQLRDEGLYKLEPRKRSYIETEPTVYDYEKLSPPTIADLSTAMKNLMLGMKDEEAEGCARHILSFFEYQSRTIDNVLEPEDRDVFYMLEDNGLLTTDREEIMLYDGRVWRINYWLLRNDKIKELVAAHKAKEEPEGQHSYDSIPEEAWQRSNGEKASV